MRVEGEIKVNGASVDANKMSILSCYIQQDDLFFGTLTVKEHLEFHVIIGYISFFFHRFVLLSIIFSLFLFRLC